MVVGAAAVDEVDDFVGGLVLVGDGELDGDGVSGFVGELDGFAAILGGDVVLDQGFGGGV